MPVTIEPDDVTQDASMLLADGDRVPIVEMDRSQVAAARRQLWMFRSAYLEAYVAATPDAVRTVLDAEDLDKHAPLHLAIAARQTELAKDQRRGASSIDEGLLFQDAFWTSRDGTTRAVTLLSPSHRRSLLALLERNAANLADRIDPLRQRIEHRDPQDWLDATPLVVRLRALIEGQSGLDEARDRARQIARRAHFEAHGVWPDEGPVVPSQRKDATGPAA